MEMDISRSKGAILRGFLHRWEIGNVQDCTLAWPRCSPVLLLVQEPRKTPGLQIVVVGELDEGHGNSTQPDSRILLHGDRVTARRAARRAPAPVGWCLAICVPEAGGHRQAKRRPLASRPARAAVGRWRPGWPVVAASPGTDTPGTVPGSRAISNAAGRSLRPWRIGVAVRLPPSRFPSRQGTPLRRMHASRSRSGPLIVHAALR